MAIIKYSKTINITSHNITMINCDISNLYVDRITGINSKGEEVIVKHIGSIINASISLMYDESYRVFNLYYDNDNGNITNQILDNEILFVSSYSKYTKRGSHIWIF